ncbi:MAG TPA: hypothetical protein VFS54_11465 [Solirubrobacterales bacterium]|nr:hypothetical protein [Solirubrobacterales bacterium]
MKFVLALLAIAAAALPAAAGGSDLTRAPEPLRAAIVSPRGVGPVHLGDTVRSLHRRHLIGRLRPGCELDRGQRVARLRSPLNGFAIFSHPNTRVRSLAIQGGAETAKGVGIGTSPAEAQEIYPNAEYDPPGTVGPFEDGFIWVNNNQSPKLTFVVDADSRVISQIDVPFPNFCE